MCYICDLQGCENALKKMALNQITLNQLFRSTNRIYMVYNVCLCIYTNNCLMWRASRKARLIMSLSHVLLPGPFFESGGSPDPWHVWPSGDLLGHNNKGWDWPGDPATTTSLTINQYLKQWFVTPNRVFTMKLLKKIYSILNEFSSLFK